MSYDEESTDEYEADFYEDFGEGFEDELSHEAIDEQLYDRAFDVAVADEANQSVLAIDENDDDYEFDSVVGGRDKKPVMSLLNKGKLSKYEMDDLLNTIDN